MSVACFWKEFHATILRDGFLDLISRTQMPARRLTRIYSLGMCSGRFVFLTTAVELENGDLMSSTFAVLNVTCPLAGVEL